MLSDARRFPLVAVMLLAALGASSLASAQTALDGFDPGANSYVYALARQADGKILVGGYFTMLGGGGTGTTGRNYIGRLNADGSLDTTFNPGANGAVLALAIQPDGKILVAGEFTMLGGGGSGTTSRNRLARLNPDGLLDESFNPGANDSVFGMALQPNGQILLGGNFTMLGGGGTGTTARNHLGRLNADGSLDAGFNPGADGLVWTFAVQPDGKILVGGQFSALGGGGTGTTPRIAIGRLNPDGSLDGTFNPGAYDGYTGSPGVFTMALQADGKIVVGGRFSALGGGTGTSPRSCIGRLNADGSVDVSFDPGANDYVWAAAVQPDGKILVGGNFYTIGGGGSGTETHYYLARLNIDGSVDADFHPDAWGWTQVIMMQPDGKILAGGGFTEIASLERNHIARLYPDGSVDADFNPGANGYSVSTIAIQPDGKILVGGNFTTLGGGNAGYYTRSRIGRLVPDGALDWSFDPGADGTVAALTVQPDGKILVGGCFSTIGGGGTGTTTRYNIARLLPDGTLDSSFNPGANDCVGTIAVQPDGKILVGGQFHTLGGGGTGSYPRYHIGRLNADGSIDASFDPGASDIVFNMTMQHDGKIVVGGWFHALGGGGTGYYSRYHIGRLNADGSIDSFDPGANDDVTGIVVEPTGTILVSGWFTTIGGGGTGYWTRNHIARLSTDGTVDSGFDPGVNYGVWSLARQADGKVVVGGWFSGMGGGTGTTVRNNIGRLHHDGSLDTTFDPGANGAVYALALQADGKVVVGGNFSTLGGGGTGTTARSTIGRVTNPDTAAEDLRVGAAGNAVTWYRSGAAPDFRHVTFESSSDGVAYTALGEAVLGADGWELTGLSLPTNQHLFIRARGRYETGFANTNGSIAESVRHAWLAAGGATGDVITTIAGTGAAVFSGDGGPATAAGVTSPFDLAVDGAGNIYLTDHMNYRVRKVWASSGSITTVAGTGVQGSSGDGGPATAAQLYTPTGIGLDSSGNLYIADYSACVVRKVTTATGLISTVAGTGTCAYNGDGRVGTATWLNNPYDVTVDAAGNLYVAEFTGSRVRKVAASTSIVTTFAGTGGLGYGGDGGAATSATLYNPTCLAADGSYLYIADTNNYRVRKVQLASGIIVTAAGTGIQGFSGDGGPATAARLNLPFGLAVDAAGSLYIADQFNQRVRKVSAGQNTITTVAGTGSVGFSGDGGPATAAALNYPQGVAVDAAGLLNIADTQNNRIRKVGPAPPPVRRGDFTGDFKADILWRHATQGEVWLWPMDGATRASESYVRTVADTDWEIRGVGDFTGGGTADVLWRNKTSGQVYLWPMDGSSPLDEIYVAAVDPAYDIVGTGDFNGDGKADILWRHMTQGDVWVWLMDGATPLDQVYVDRVPLRYQVRGVGDLDADANADIVWRSATAGDVWVWRMNGATRLDVVWIGTVPELGYDIQAVDDFDGDGRADILWWHATHGEVWIWTMNGTARVAETWVANVPDTEYRVASTGDYDGDGSADILWRHATRGEVWIWLMDGPTRVAESWVATVPDVGYRVAAGGGPDIVTITFSGLSGTGAPAPPYDEQGFTVAPDSADWLDWGYGAPGPAMVYQAAATVTREVHVEAGGRPFSFLAVDLYSSTTQIPYEIIGTRNASPVFSLVGTMPYTWGNYVTLAHPTGQHVIDALVIRLTNPVPSGFTNPVGLDNLVLRR